MNEPNIYPINFANLLKKYNINPNKRLGQNFLISDSAIIKIIQAAELTKNDLVLEIGPGPGNLTRYLGHYSKKVKSIEIDEKFKPVLDETLNGLQNVEVIFSDALEVNYDEIFQEKYKVVANIPYYITSALIRKILESKSKPELVVLTVQKEVAERICSQQGNLNILALSVQVFGEPMIIMNIPSKSFYPSPNVDSAVVLIEIYQQPFIDEECLDTFFDIVKAGFSQKRKKVSNSLSSGLHLGKNEVEKFLDELDMDPNARPQHYSLENWKVITDYLCKNEN